MCFRVMVLDNGSIAEYAPPDELLANKSSIFYSMCRDAGIQVNAGAGAAAGEAGAQGAHSSSSNDAASGSDTKQS